MKFPVLLLVASTSMLASCGGASTGTAEDDSASYTSLANAAKTAITKQAAATPTPTVATTGTATYRGMAAFSRFGYTDPAVDPDIVANVTLNANFGDNTIAGSLDSFADRENSVYAGVVFVNDGKIVDNKILASLSGTLTNGTTPFAVSGSLDGVFVGADAIALRGAFAALMGEIPLLGAFGAEK